jgi:hypothetical protein
VLRKVQHGEKHISNLDTTIKSFFESAPFHLRMEDNPNLPKGVLERDFYLAKAEDIPIEVSFVAGDALHNLRSALDHLVWQLVLANGGTPDRHTSFPIAESEAKFKSPAMRVKVRGCAKAAVDAIEALKPFKRGNNVLWSLHALNNLDKHRMVLTARNALTARSMTPSERAEVERIFRGSYGPDAPMPDLSETLKSLPQPIPIKSGDVLATLPHPELVEEMKFHLDITFNEPEVPQFDSVLGFLQKASGVVRDIISGCEGFLV